LEDKAEPARQTVFKAAQQPGRGNALKSYLTEVRRLLEKLKAGG
jgi:hypothetical protein